MAEKGRVVGQLKEERNCAVDEFLVTLTSAVHILYQSVCAADSTTDRAD